MTTFSQDQTPTRIPSAEGTWIRQASSGEIPSNPAWQGQPNGRGAAPVPAWQGQPNGGAATAWQGQPNNGRATPVPAWQGQPNGGAATAWQGQPNNGGAAPIPAWSGQPTPLQTPAWPEQPASTGTPPPSPAWLAQHDGLPVIEPTKLQSGPTWPALRFIARWLKIIAWIELVLGIIGALVEGGTFGGGIGLILIAFLLIIAMLGFIFTYASAEGILVMLKIEKNTRKSE